MKIGIVVLSVGIFGNKGFYNLQEVGLAKALDKLCDKVIVYKHVSKKEKKRCEKIKDTKHATIYYLPVKSIGTNGIPELSAFDNTIDVLICFSDTQIGFPKLYSWTCANDVIMIPYIGVVKSHSVNKIKSMIISVLYLRNLRIYKKCLCLAKTKEVEKTLITQGASEVVVCPIGLDFTQVKKDYEHANCMNIKKKYGFNKEDKIILFIGRMVDEKKPLQMINIYRTILKENPNYKLLMVGKGELLFNVKETIKENSLFRDVTIIEQIPNDEIWELYLIADWFVNLNEHEIFGMSILESMYYRCRVIAWEAPGPNLIIKNGVTGYLVKSVRDVVKVVLDEEKLPVDSKKVIEDGFCWDTSAKTIVNLLN